MKHADKVKLFNALIEAKFGSGHGVVSRVAAAIGAWPGNVSAMRKGTTSVPVKYLDTLASLPDCEVTDLGIKWEVIGGQIRAQFKTLVTEETLERLALASRYINGMNDNQVINLTEEPEQANKLFAKMVEAFIEQENAKWPAVSRRVQDRIARENNTTVEGPLA